MKCTRFATDKPWKSSRMLSEISGRCLSVMGHFVFHVRSPAPHSRRRIVLAEQEVRKIEPKDLAGGFEGWIQRMLSSVGTGRPDGILVFKWCENQVSTAEVLKLASWKPLFGHRRGKTVFLVFMKTTTHE